jgi:hypothetical protein
MTLQTRYPRLLPAIVLAGGLALAGWMALRSYTTPWARECAQLYRDAHSAAEIAAVDATVPASERRPERRTCGKIRANARWF